MEYSVSPVKSQPERCTVQIHLPRTAAQCPPTKLAWRDSRVAISFLPLAPRIVMTRKRRSVFVATYRPFFFRNSGRPRSLTTLGAMPNSFDAFRRDTPSLILETTWTTESQASLILPRQPEILLCRCGSLGRTLLLGFAECLRFFRWTFLRSLRFIVRFPKTTRPPAGVNF